MNLWEDVDPNQLATDTAKFTQQVAKDLTKKTGATPNSAPDPVKTLNKSVLDVAKQDPTTATKALNKSAPVQKMKKMKKENVFPTLLQWREMGAGAGVPYVGQDPGGAAGGWQGAAGDGKLISVGDVKMKKKSKK